MESGPGSEVLQAIDSADDFVHNARRVPWTDQARLRRADLDNAVSRIERGADAAGIEASGAFANALARLKRIAADARPIPLTSDVRCDRETFVDLLDELRDSFPKWLLEAREHWKQAGGVDPPGTAEISINPGEGGF